MSCVGLGVRSALFLEKGHREGSARGNVKRTGAVKGFRKEASSRGLAKRIRQEAWERGFVKRLRKEDSSRGFAKTIRQDEGLGAKRPALHLDAWSSLDESSLRSLLTNPLSQAS